MANTKLCDVCGEAIRFGEPYVQTWPVDYLEGVVNRAAEGTSSRGRYVHFRCEDKRGRHVAVTTSDVGPGRPRGAT